VAVDKELAEFASHRTFEKFGGEVLAGGETHDI
jgi:hypothetical protein